MFTPRTARRMTVFLLLSLSLILGGIGPIAAQSGPVTITILNTSDEHGWIQPTTPNGSSETLGGAANLYARWLQDEGYDPATMLLLSGGDNWTGPAISTWFEGEPMVELMNTMGYDATALATTSSTSGGTCWTSASPPRYPYLAANIRDAATGELANFALPYVIDEVNGVRVGIVGLATTATATTTNPANIGDLTFAPYAATLQAVVPQMRAEGAQVIVGLTHICVDELSELAKRWAGWWTPSSAGTATPSSPPRSTASQSWQRRAVASYARLDLVTIRQGPRDRCAGPSGARGLQRRRQPGHARSGDRRHRGRLAGARRRRPGSGDRLHGERPGPAQSGDGQPRHRRLAVGLPGGRRAMTNNGGFRQAIDAGPIALADMVLLPSTTICTRPVTGASWPRTWPAAARGGGIAFARRGGYWTSLSWTGRPSIQTATLRVLVTDFMYFGGDGYLSGPRPPPTAPASTRSSLRSTGYSSAPPRPTMRWRTLAMLLGARSNTPAACWPSGAEVGQGSAPSDTGFRRDCLTLGGIHALL